MIRHYSAALAALALLSTSALAADLEDTNACTIAGLVQAGGMLDHQNVEWASATFKDALDWPSAFAEGALSYACNGWGAQIEAAGYGFKTDGENFNRFSMKHKAGHVGGALFWRDDEWGAVGLSASRIFQSYSYDRTAFHLSDSTAIWRAGGFAQYYVNDAVTLGGSVHYIDGETGFFDPIVLKGFEGDAFIKYYATENLALRLKGDILRSDYLLPNGSKFADIEGEALSLDAEYLIPETSASLFVEGRYSHRDVVRTIGSTLITLNDLQGIVGVKFAFGGPPPATLRDRDRKGTFDNTSVFQEKMPGLASAMPNN